MIAIAIPNIVSTSNKCFIVSLIHNVGALFVFDTIDGTFDAVHIGLGDEILTVGSRHLVPIPPRDDIVQSVAVALVVHRYLVDRFALSIIRADLHPSAIIVSIVGIKVGLHVKQLQFTVRGCCDGQRQVYLLRVSIGRTRIGRHFLFINVNFTLHIPVVGLGVIGRADDIGIVRGIAVVDNTLRRVDKVT